MTPRSLRDAILSIRGCVGLYMGDELAGTLARDLTNTNPGTYTGSPIQGKPPVTPYSVAAVKYSGAPQYILVKSGFVLAALTNASVVAEIRIAATSGSDRVIYCERASAGNDIWKYQVDLSTGLIRFTHRDDAGTINQPAGTTNVRGSHVVGFSKAGTAISHYTDGLVNGTGTLTGNDTYTNASPESRIGADKADGAGSAWTETIGFVGLFNRALTQGEHGFIAAYAMGR